MHQGGEKDIENNTPTKNGINIETGASESTIAAENGQRPGTLTKK